MDQPDSAHPSFQMINLMSCECRSQTPDIPQEKRVQSSINMLCFVVQIIKHQSNLCFYGSKTSMTRPSQIQLKHLEAHVCLLLTFDNLGPTDPYATLVIFPFLLINKLAIGQMTSQAMEPAIRLFDLLFQKHLIKPVLLRKSARKN